MRALLEAILAKDEGGVSREVACCDDLNDQDRDGRSLLMTAVVHSSPAIVRLLIDCGADVNLADTGGFTALHFAAQEWQIESVEALVNAGAEVDAPDKFGNTPHWRAVFASRGRGEVIQILLDRGADRNRRNASGISPLALAERIGNYNIAPLFRSDPGN